MANTSKKIIKTAETGKVDYRFLYKLWKQAQNPAEKDFYYSFIHFPTFASTYLKIRDKQGLIRPLKFNTVQKLVFPILSQHNKAVILKYRQGGISTLIAGYFFWLTILFSLSTLVLAHTRESAQILFEMPKRFYDKMLGEVKEFLQLQTKYENKMELSFEKKDAKYYVGSTEDGFGRGQTVQNLHLSEFAFWKQIGVKNLPSLLEAVPLEIGKVYFESTPNGLNHFYDKYMNAKEGKSRYKAIFLPWYKHPEYKLKPWFTEKDLTPEEIELIKKYNLTLEQIAFRRDKIIDLKEFFFQEYPEDDETCFLLSTTSVFNTEIITQILHTLELEKIKPVITDSIATLFGIHSNKTIEIYKKPEKNKQYVVSVDPAGGDTQSTRLDPTAIVVIEKDMPYKIVAIFNDKINHTELSALIYELALYYNDALVVVERNNHGHLILYNLENGFTYHGRLYNKYENIYTDNQSKLGWLTTSKSKGIIIENFAEQFQMGNIAIPSKEILNQMTHYVEKRSTTGKIITEAESGHHDDLVMAIAFGLYIAQTYKPDNGFVFRFDFL